MATIEERKTPEVRSTIDALTPIDAHAASASTSTGLGPSRASHGNTDPFLAAAARELYGFVSKVRKERGNGSSFDQKHFNAQLESFEEEYRKKTLQALPKVRSRYHVGPMCPSDRMRNRRAWLLEQRQRAAAKRVRRPRKYNKKSPCAGENDLEEDGEEEAQSEAYTLRT